MLIHWPDAGTPIAETMGALEQLKRDGKIRHYGVSNYTVAMMEECEAVGHLTANQVGYNLFDRRMEHAVLPYCRNTASASWPTASLGFGLLSGAFTPETTFVEWDWRAKGNAFGLPLFERENFLAELRVVEQLKALAARCRQERGPAGHRLGAGQPGRDHRTGRRAQSTASWPRTSPLPTGGWTRHTRRDRPHLRGRGRADVCGCEQAV